MFSKKAAAAGAAHEDLTEKVKKLEAEHKAAVELSESLTATLESQALQFETKLHESRTKIKQWEQKHNDLLEAIKAKYPDWIPDITPQNDVQYDHPTEKIAGDGLDHKPVHGDNQELLEQLRRQTEKLVETNAHLAQELQQSEMKLAEMQATHQIQIDELRRQNEIDLQKSEQTLQEQWQQERQALQQEYHRTESELDATIRRMKSDHVTQQESVHKTEKQVADLQQKLTEAESELATLRTQIDQSANVSDTLHATAVRDRDRMAEQLKAAEETLARVQSEYEQRCTELGQSQARISDLTTDCEELRKQLQSERSQRRAAEEELHQLQIRLSRATEDSQEQTRSHAAIMHQLLSECEEIRTRYDATRQEQAALSEQLQQRLTIGSEMLRDTRHALELATESNNHHTERIEQQAQTIVSLQEQLQGVKSELEHSSTEHDKALMEAADRCRQLEEKLEVVQREAESIKSEYMQKAEQAERKGQEAVAAAEERVRDVEQRMRQEATASEAASIERQNELKKALKAAQSELDSVIKSLHDEQRREKEVANQLAEALADKIAMSKRVNCLEAEIQQHLDADARRQTEESGLMGRSRPTDTAGVDWRRRLEKVFDCIPRRKRNNDPMNTLWDEASSPSSTLKF